MTITESDWQVFRGIRGIALDRSCQRVLQELDRISGDATLSHHQRYLKIYQHIREQDREIALGFDHNSRSHAFDQVLFFRSRRLLTDEEFSRFSPDLCTRVENIIAVVNKNDGEPDEEPE